MSEIIGTFMLVFGVLAIAGNELGARPGGRSWSGSWSGASASRWADRRATRSIRPATSGPRIAHAVLPIAGKGESDWGYCWIPVVGPIVGGILGAVAYNAVFTNYLMA